MSDGIKKGDLVMVIRPPRCGCYSGVMGLIGRVYAIVHEAHAMCVGCGCLERLNEPVARITIGNDSDWTISLWRLKRIDPPAKTEAREEELVLTRHC